MATTRNHGRRWKKLEHASESCYVRRTRYSSRLHRNRKTYFVFVFFKRPLYILTQERERASEEIMEDFVSGTRIAQGFLLLRLNKECQTTVSRALYVNCYYHKQ